MVGCGPGRSPGEAGLCCPPSQPQAAGPVPEEAVPAAQHPGRSPARHRGVSEPVQTREVELLHQGGPVRVRIRVNER